MPLPASRRHLLLAAASLVAPRVAVAAQAMRSDWPRGKTTPDMRVRLLDAPDWSPAGERGHPVLLNFWATWCEPCRDEMPALARLAARERASGLQVLAINYREGEDVVRGFVRSTALSLPVALDPDGGIARRFDAHVFPSTVAIGADGRARFTVVGECDWTDARSRRWLAELA